MSNLVTSCGEAIQLCGNRV
jgi:hypothetical protein